MINLQQIEEDRLEFDDTNHFGTESLFDDDVTEEAREAVKDFDLHGSDLFPDYEEDMGE